MLCWPPAVLTFRCGIIAATAASCSTSQAGLRANAPRGTSFKSSLVNLQRIIDEFHDEDAVGGGFFNFYQNTRQIPT